MLNTKCSIDLKFCLVKPTIKKEWRIWFRFMRISYISSKMCYLATPPSCSLPPTLHHTELLIWIHHITNHHKCNQSNSSQYHSFTNFSYSKIHEILGSWSEKRMMISRYLEPFTILPEAFLTPCHFVQF